MTIYKHTSITATIHQCHPASRTGVVVYEVRDITNNVLLLRRPSFFLHIQSEATFENNFIAEYQTPLDQYNFLSNAHRGDPAESEVLKNRIFGPA